MTTECLETVCVISIVFMLKKYNLFYVLQEQHRYTCIGSLNMHFQQDKKKITFVRFLLYTCTLTLKYISQFSTKHLQLRWPIFLSFLGVVAMMQSGKVVPNFMYLVQNTLSQNNYYFSKEVKLIQNVHWNTYTIHS